MMDTEAVNQGIPTILEPVFVLFGDSYRYITNGDKKKVLSKDFGVVFYWSEYDDFSCYGDGFIHRVKIIEGVK